MTTDIEVKAEGSVQTLRLTRPAKKNALTGDMYRALADALMKGDADAGISAHVFLGLPGVFSAGNDIKDFLETSRGSGGLSADVERFIRALPLTVKPMLAAVDGLAVGVGTTLLMHCDLVYASPRATFSTPFLDLGLVPEAGSSLIAPRIMGYPRAFELLVLGDTFSAERALTAGLVNAIAAPDAVEAMALAAAQRLAHKPPEALRQARKLMRGEAAVVLEQIDREVAAFKERLASPEALEAFQAFLEKRPPKFGRG